MCGIVCQYYPQSGSSLDTVRKGLEALRHRGPDTVATWQSANRQVSLGHARLSVVDILSGGQPFFTEDQSICVVVNGEFYDFERIRTELEAAGHVFRSKSDSEILPHLYEEYGVDCLSRLRGEFAFVLWDNKTGTLFAARDRFGIKPLFYAEANGGISLASEVKALHASGTEAGWDEDGLLQTILMLGNIDGTTHFRDVSSIPPAHYLIAKAGAVSLHSYWNFDYPKEDAIQERSKQDLCERFLSILSEAVRLRMRADVPVGCYLSGGLDSCSILALMAQHGGAPIRVFSLAFDHPAYDESSVAREMAELVGADFTGILVSRNSLAQDFSDAVWHAETLFANAHGVAKFGLSRVVRQAGYKVILSGEGADETLAGYPIFRIDMEQRNSGSSGTKVFLDRLGYVPSWYEAREASMLIMGGFLPASFCSHDIFGSLLERIDISGQMRGRHVLNQSLYLHSKVVLPGYILTVLGDRMEMAHSVEGRVPFLDHHVVEFLRQLPVSYKLSEKTEKYILRESIKTMIPARVHANPKNAFQAPPILCSPEEPLYALMQDTLRGDALKSLPLINRPAVIDALDRIPTMSHSDRMGLEIPVTQLLSACLMGERFGL
jgi:asparagine synthase (glutamine-hydrolysing)